MKARTDFRPFRPGVSWKNGKLYAFSRNDVLVLAPWPNLRAWRRTKALPWHRVRPRISALDSDFSVNFRESRIPLGSRFWQDFPRLPDNAKEKRAEALSDPAFATLLQKIGLHETTLRLDRASEALCLTDSSQRARLQREAHAKFWESVPPNIRARIERFPSHHWHLASLFSRCPASVDLADSTPALAMALANAWIFNRRPSRTTMRWVRRHLSKPQRVLCGLLGFPATESAVHILRKLAPAHCRPAILLGLRALMRVPGMLDHLRHAPDLPTHLIRFLSMAHRRGWAVSRRMVLRWLAHFADASRRLNQDWDHVRDALRALKPASDNHPVLPFHSVQALLRDHQARNNALAGRLARQREIEAFGHEVHADEIPFHVFFSEEAAVELPPCPLPGNEAIQPLRTGRDVFEESREMRHCVASYLPLLKEGEVFIYRVLQPERATLELRYDGGIWRQGQLAGVANAPVSAQTQLLVIAWLTHHQPVCMLDLEEQEHKLEAAA